MSYVTDGKMASKSPAARKNFTQACNILNQFLKEKGSLKDLNINRNLQLPTQVSTIDFLSNMENPSPAPVKSLSPLPQLITVESFLAGDNKPKTAAMTVFYGGQVMVFDEFPEEKIKEIMLLANRGKAPVTSPSNYPAIILEANGSDLPIARRASLHKFLAKRRDRATARAAPYQLPTSSHQKDELKFDLNL